jgi:hypothetical protein
MRVLFGASQEVIQSLNITRSFSTQDIRDTVWMAIWNISAQLWWFYSEIRL